MKLAMTVIYNVVGEADIKRRVEQSMTEAPEQLTKDVVSDVMKQGWARAENSRKGTPIDSITFQIIEQPDDEACQ